MFAYFYVMPLAPIIIKQLYIHQSLNLVES